MMKVVKRFNVLYLMTMAYAVLVVLFAVLACSGNTTIAETWDALEAPLMALIGGTLAISKDLIAGDSPHENEKRFGNLKDKETQDQ